MGCILGFKSLWVPCAVLAASLLPPSSMTFAKTKSVLSRRITSWCYQVEETSVWESLEFAWIRQPYPLLNDLIRTLWQAVRGEITRRKEMYSKTEVSRSYQDFNFLYEHWLYSLRIRSSGGSIILFYFCMEEIYLWFWRCRTRLTSVLQTVLGPWDEFHEQGGCDQGKLSLPKDFSLAFWLASQ